MQNHLFKRRFETRQDEEFKSGSNKLYIALADDHCDMNYIQKVINDIFMFVTISNWRGENATMDKIEL